MNLNLLWCPTFFGFYDFSQDKSFHFFRCSPFILFSEFSHYKKFKFFYFIFWLLIIPSLLYAEKMEEDTKVVIFIYKKLQFLSQTGLFSLILWLYFVCFFASHNTKASIFFVNLSLLRCPTFFGFCDFSQGRSFHFFGCSPFILFRVLLFSFHLLFVPPFDVL